MSFWNNDEAERQAALRRQEDLERRRADDERRKQRAKLARQQEVTRQKEQKALRAQQAAEDKKLRDELMEKMLGAATGKGDKQKNQLPTLNRGLGGDRAVPSQQTFQYLKARPGSNQPGTAGHAVKSDNTMDTHKSSGGAGALPPLKRPF